MCMCACWASIHSVCIPCNPLDRERTISLTFKTCCGSSRRPFVTRISPTPLTSAPVLCGWTPCSLLCNTSSPVDTGTQGSLVSCGQTKFSICMRTFFLLQMEEFGLAAPDQTSKIRLSLHPANTFRVEKVGHLGDGLAC